MSDYCSLAPEDLNKTEPTPVPPYGEQPNDNVVGIDSTMAPQNSLIEDEYSQIVWGDS
jgi:hypothetical protein